MGEPDFAVPPCIAVDAHRGARALAGYRHYKLDGAGNIAQASWLEADDDEEAVRQVREQQLRFGSEIWRGERLIARIEAAKREF